MVRANCFPFFSTVSTPLWPLKAQKPARSPSRRWLTSSFTTPLQRGPSMRWVSVLGAVYRLSTMRLVLSLSQPGLSLSDHALSTGLWFHCQCRSSFGPLKSSLTVMGCRGCPLLTGRMRSGTRPSSSPSMGQPSSQRQGISVTTRPTAPRSWKMMPNQSPCSVSTMVPCPTCGKPFSGDCRMTFFSYGPCMLSER